MTGNLNIQRGNKIRQRRIWIAVAILFIIAFTLLHANPVTMNTSFHHVWLLIEYFTEIESIDTQVEFPKNLFRSIYFFKDPETLVWRVREAGDSNWTEYKWELYSMKSSTLAELRSRGIPTNNWWTDWAESYGYIHNEIRAILLPSNEEALEIHIELGLPLPEDFSVDDLNNEYDESMEEGAGY